MGLRLPVISTIFWDAAAIVVGRAVEYNDLWYCFDNGPKGTNAILCVGWLSQGNKGIKERECVCVNSWSKISPVPPTVLLNHFQWLDWNRAYGRLLHLKRIFTRYRCPGIGHKNVCRKDDVSFIVSVKGILSLEIERPSQYWDRRAHLPLHMGHHIGIIAGLHHTPHCPAKPVNPDTTLEIHPHLP